MLALLTPTHSPAIVEFHFVACMLVCQTSVPNLVYLLKFYEHDFRGFVTVNSA
jgi:cytochrome oxidase Cu insertion factor (SCO1/SenC/PrrC family)